MDNLKINAVAFKEGDAWIVQGIEYDIVAHATTITALPLAFTRAVLENMLITEHLGRRPLEGIKPAPERFRQLFDNAIVEMVTAQVACGSDGSERQDQLFRPSHERAEDIPALLSGGREHGSDDHEVVGAGLSAESAGDFLPQLHHARVAFGLVVGKGHVRIVQKPQYAVPALLEAQEEIMADA